MRRLGVTKRLLLLLGLGLVCFTAGSRPGAGLFFAQEPAQGKKYALLVGVDKYEKGSLLPGLPFPRRDVEELAKVFLQAGYEKDNVVIMTKERGLEDFDLMPTAEHIRNQFQLLLAQLKPGDSIIVALAGHGVLMLVPADKPEEKPHPKSFFCPMDANLAHQRLPRFIDFDELYKALADSPATVKLLLVDACRNKLLAEPEGRPGGIEMPAPPPPPASVAALFSCSGKEVSWEDSGELDGGHGVFFHYVIQGFSGKADEWERGNHNHKVELDGLLQLRQGQRPGLRGKQALHRPASAAGGRPRPRRFARHLYPVVGPQPSSPQGSARSELKRIPAGTFQMGSPAGEGSEDEHPQHEVRITRPFYLGVPEVSRARSEAVMGNNPSDFSAAGGGKDKVAGLSTGELPVETVSWLDAVKFCNKLSELEGRRPFYEIAGETVRVPDWKASGYRLPTEAEWEYACGGDPANLNEHAWLGGYSGAMPHPAGKKLANRFGLHDMLGNVWEWCWNAYDKDYYKQSPPDDPTGPDAAGAASRVVRGGCWGLILRCCRSAYRKRFTPVFQHGALGFRLALVTIKEQVKLKGD